MKITDEGIAGLPVAEGRAELLEEIMALPTIETQTSRDRATKRHLIPALAAAAAVAAIAGAVALPRLLEDEPRGVEAPVMGAPAGGELAVLTAAGWEVEWDDADPADGGVSYLKDDQQLEISWEAASSYDAKVADRDDVSARTSVDVLGESAIMWTYSAQDHAVIRPAGATTFLEIRGSGMGEARFFDILGQLELVDDAGLADHLAAAPRVSREDRLFNEPPKPMLIDAAGWTPVVDDQGEVAWEGPDGARVAVVWVSGVSDPFTYDRYRDADVREQVQLLGGAALHAAWEEGGTAYEVVASRPVVGDTILVLEGTGLNEEQFLDLVDAAGWVTLEEYERVVRGAIG